MKICPTLFLGLLLLADAAGAEYSTPDDWAISAAFPQPTKIESSQEESVIGSIKQVAVSAEEGEEEFGIFQMRFPGKVADSQLEMLYQSAKQSGLREGKGVLQQEEKTAIADHEGRRYVVDFPTEKRRGDYRVTVIGQTLYMAGYEAPIASFSALRAKKFFRSIRPRSDGSEATVETPSAPSAPVKKPSIVRSPPAAPPTKSLAPETPWALEATFSQPPKSISAEEATPFGPVRNTTLAMAEGQVVYAISRVIYPVATAGHEEEIIKTTKDSLLRKGKGSLQREEKIAIADLPGHRYVVDYAHEFVLDDYRADYRLVLIDQVLYVVMYRSPLNFYSADKARAFFKTVKRKPR